MVKENGKKMDKEIPVSIIMPTFEIDETEPALRHLLKQKYSNKEIIVINDNPRLKIPPTLLELIKTNEIRLINNPENLGIAESLNVGIRAAKTNTILTICNDYFPESENLIKHIVEKLYSDEEIVVVGALLKWDIKSWHDYNFLTKLFTFNKMIEEDPIDTGNYKKDLLLKVGLFDSKNFKSGGEDIDLVSRIKKSGYKIVYSEEGIIHSHYNNKNSVLNILKKEYAYGKSHGICKRKDGILKRIGVFDFELRLLFIIGFIIGLFINPLISLFCFLPFFFAALIKCIRAYPQTKWLPGLILSPFAVILVFLIQTVGATKEYFKIKSIF